MSQDPGTLSQNDVTVHSRPLHVQLLATDPQGAAEPTMTDSRCRHQFQSSPLDRSKDIRSGGTQASMSCWLSCSPRLSGRQTNPCFQDD